MAARAARHDAGSHLVGAPAVPRNVAPSHGTELRAGLNGAVVSLGIALPLGVIALAPLGAGYIGAGIRAALVSAVVGNAVATMAGGIRLPNSGPRASVTLIFAAFVASLAADPSIGRGADARRPCCSWRRPA